jgi:hypothetical protein
MVFPCEAASGLFVGGNNFLDDMFVAAKLAPLTFFAIIRQLRSESSTTRFPLPFSFVLLVSFLGGLHS